MGRSFAVGFIAFALVLAGSSIGVATYVAAKNTEPMQAQIEQLAESVTQKVTPVVNPVTEPEPAPVFQPSSEETQVVAVGDDYALWSKGRLLVTTNEETPTVVFQVDPKKQETGLKGKLGVDGKLTVSDLAELTDVDASGKVEGDSFSTGGFTADGAGRVEASSFKVAGNGEFGGDLVVKGDSVELGVPEDDVAPFAFSYDKTLDMWHLVVVGKITTTEFESLSETTEFSHLNVYSLAASDTITSEGDLSGKDVAAGNSLSVNTSKFTVDAAGNTALAGTLKVAGASDLANVTADNLDLSGTLDVAGASTFGQLTATNLIGTSSLNVGGGDFTVSAAGDTRVAGTLEVVGATTAGQLTADDVYVNNSLAVATDKFVVTSAGNASMAGTLDVSGTATMADISGAAISGTDLAVSSGLTVNTDRFTVASNGNTSIAGTLGAGGDATLNGKLSVAGDTALDGKLSVAGDATLAKLTSSDLIATSSLNVASGNFTVDSAGNLYAAGNLAVDGSVSVAGDASVDGTMTVGGAVVANNLPSNVRQGVEKTTGGTATVTVAGMPATASVIVTPREALTTPGDYYVTVTDGQFVITGENNRDFSWMAMW